MKDEVKEDTSVLLALIERETEAFFCRDFEGWAECWLHAPHIRRLGYLAGGVTEYITGWDGGETTRHIFAQFPTPNPDAAKQMRRKNFTAVMSRDMAWASFDQYGAKTNDPLVPVGLSHQIRIFERVDDQWKIVMAGHGDSDLEYFDYPVIRVVSDFGIEWMNDAACDEMEAHPALVVSNGVLRGRYREDDKLMRATLNSLSELTIMGRKPSLLNPRGRSVIPITLTGGEADGQHIVWLSVRNGMLLVSLRDQENQRALLRAAAALYQLSPTQLRIAELVFEGRNLQQIAEDLAVSASTVKTHLGRVFDKTGARSQPALISRLLAVNPPI